MKSCYSDDLDVCILPNAENTGIVPPIMAERTSMLKIKDKTEVSEDTVNFEEATQDQGCPRRCLRGGRSSVEEFETH